MNAKASDVAARLGRAVGGSQTPAPAAPVVAAPTPIRSAAKSSPQRTTERFTVDLTAELNDALGEWATRRKRSVGRRVAKTEVARVLIELLLGDPSLAMQVEERLRAEKG